MKYKKDECIAFNSYNEHFVLSNMYPCKLQYKDRLFYGVEHLYYYLRFYEHREIQNKIMSKCKGVLANFNVKRIARENKELIDNQTPRQRHTLLEKCIELKANQCKEFREYLCSIPSDKHIVEFAYWGDTEYGCVLKGDTYEGDNVCGCILEKVKASIL